jgi:hypothetical protein
MKDEQSATDFINSLTLSDGTRKLYWSHWRNRTSLLDRIAKHRAQVLENKQKREENRKSLKKQSTKLVLNIPKVISPPSLILNAETDLIDDQDYCGAKIYRIVSSNGQYIGSTIATLKQRLKTHEWFVKNSKCKHHDVKQILGGEDCRIILLEHYPCKNRSQLRTREQFWIDLLPCVNTRTAATTDKKNMRAAQWMRDRNQLNKINK